MTGASGHLPSRLAVEEIAVASVGTALLAAAALSEQRGGSAGPVALDRGHVGDAVRSERFFRIGGQAAGAGFAPLSRFWAAADGWVRTHANYPWHREALVSALRTPEEIGAVAAAMADLPAEEIERRVFAAGGIATAVRTTEEWDAHPQGRAVAAEPLIGHRMTGDGPARERAAADLPMAGVRVLDLTRVIAGPVCTRFLAALGAEVLRLDPPSRPDMATGVIADSLLGKRSAFLDLELPGGVAVLQGLLDRADAVVCGYRPGALDRFGLGEEALTERHPGIVAVYLDAWGHSGPWAGRRGFDSVVQGPTGIAMGESPDGLEPGALPCQLLDHGTGYLAAAAALDGLRRQGDQGGTHVRRLSLARTALWLTSQGTRPHRDGGPAGAGPDSPGSLVRLERGGGAVTAVAPPGALGGRRLQWPSPPTGYADGPATWPSG
ncbi:MAG TPA: CoA transferase [Acidimicrobiales bacterium]